MFAPGPPTSCRHRRHQAPGRRDDVRHVGLGQSDAGAAGEKGRRARADAGRQGVLCAGRRRGERERDQDGALDDGTAKGHHAPSLLSRRNGRRDGAFRRQSRLELSARPARSRPRAAAVLLSLPVRADVSGLRHPLRRSHRRVDRVGRAADRGGGAGRAGRRDERHHGAAGILAAPARNLRPLRRAAHRRRGDERVRADGRHGSRGKAPHPCPSASRVRQERGACPGHDDAGEGLDGGVHAAGRGRRQQKGRRLL